MLARSISLRQNISMISPYLVVLTFGRERIQSCSRSYLVDCKVGDTLGDFIRRSPRSAKIARCAQCSDCEFRRSPPSVYNITDIWHVRHRRLNSPVFAKCARSRAFFYVYCCESSVNPTHQVGRFYHMSFQNCHISAIGEKNRRCVRINRQRKSLAIKFASIGV